MKLQVNLAGGVVMTKEEILKKSREEHFDEGTEYIQNKGIKIGYIIFTMVFSFLVIFNMFFGESETFYALSACFWIFVSNQAYIKYRYLKNKVYLITVIAGGLVSILSIITYIMDVLR